ncbi:M43 family zinc metalloprotease [Flavisolibacter ginsenosidimutans]|nr:M43 family zinc metalloprotease [Flavisolibacter ginsenosidimutans]
MRSLSKFLLGFLLPFSLPSLAQKASRVSVEQCATMQRLEERLQRNPALRLRFEAEQAAFNKRASEKTAQGKSFAENRTAVYIPVVFHVVLSNPAVVTDAQLQAQLDTLNKNFFGNNGDSVRIPSYFKSFFGKSSIQFCLAQRTPDGEPTTGIVRVTTAQASFGTDDGAKHTTSGGDDSWNTDKYFNVWVCPLSGGLLGYATFPNDGSPAEQGVVMDYRSLPGGSYSAYNGGKTLTHETGHYFNLYHIWGDDNGACTGTDYVDDTPNQADASSGAYTGVRTDACTSVGNGIMYQNYMDYTNDVCLVMFTTQQASRMETALSLYRSSLLSSDGCQVVVPKNYDAKLKTITTPNQRLCGSNFTPVITLQNKGTQTLTSLLITAKIDNGNASTTPWSGSLAYGQTSLVTLSQMTATVGNHVLTVYVSKPNAVNDENNANDTLTLNFQYYEPVSQVSESFENTAFPPTAWDVVNPDNGITWQRTTAAAKTGLASAMIDNFDNSQVGQKDDLRMPTVRIASTVDSAFLSFQVAAAAYTATTTTGNTWDTLEVLVSTDCGQTYASLYKKWGASLVTETAPKTSFFVPSSTQWRKDSINLAGYIGKDNLLFAFRNTTGYENNVYLDDVNLRTITINPNLKARKFLVTPNPTTGQIAVQFYQPSGLQLLQVFTSTGQKVKEVIVGNGAASNTYRFDLSQYASGIYVVRAVFADCVFTERVIKY